jgi:hypothetical protein
MLTVSITAASKPPILDTNMEVRSEIGIPSTLFEVEI